MAFVKYTKQQLAEELAVDGKNTYGRLVTGPTMSLDEVADEIAHITGMQTMACANVLRALTMRLSTEMKALLEQIKVTVQSDGTVDDDEDDTTPSTGGNTSGTGTGDTGGNSGTGTGDTSGTDDGTLTP